METAFAAWGLDGGDAAPVVKGGLGSALPQAVRAARIAVALRAMPNKVAMSGPHKAHDDFDRLDNVFGPDPWGD